jgi:hypothetical protein
VVIFYSDGLSTFERLGQRNRTGLLSWGAVITERRDYCKEWGETGNGVEGLRNSGTVD